MVSVSDFPSWAVKLIGTVLLFLLSMIFGAIPLKLSRDANQPTSQLRDLLISLSNCFAGGVFFSTVVLDLIPMVKETTHDALNSVNIETDFPLGEFIIGFGFIMMLIIEQFVHTCFGDSFLSHPGHSHDEEINNEVFFDRNDFLEIDSDSEDDETRKLLNPVAGIVNPGNSSDTIPTPKKSVTLGEAEILHGNSISYTDSDEERDIEQSHQSHHSYHSHRSGKSYDTVYSEGGTRHRVNRLNRTKSLASMQSITHSNFRTYVLVFAISLHSLFEGLAVGLTPDTQTLLNLFVALLIHKSIIAFSIGVQLVDADFRSLHVIICLFIFASMAPVGVGIGVLVLDFLNNIVRKFCSAILQGIATGSFFYVTFFEVLPHELNIEDNKKPLKILFVLFGYIVTTGICYYENRFHKVSHVHIHNQTTTTFSEHLLY